MVERTVAQLRDAGVEATGSVAVGSRFSVAKRIVDVAHGWTADAVVLGSTRRRLRYRRRGRGIREQVIRRTPLPVLTAPSPLVIGGRHRTPADELAQLRRTYSDLLG